MVMTRQEIKEMKAAAMQRISQEPVAPIANDQLIQLIAEVVQQVQASKVVQASQSPVFRSGTHVVTITEVKVTDHTNKSGVTNPWVQFTLKRDGYNRPAFADITLAGNSLKVVSDLSLELTGKALTVKSNYSKFLESLKGMAIRAVVNEKLTTDKNKTVLTSYVGSWRAV